MILKKFRLNSYKSIEESEIEFEISDLEGQYHKGLMMIFATISLPMEKQILNQVWQVGSSVINGKFPAVHAFQPENLSSMSKLDLVTGQSILSSSQDNSRLRNKNVSLCHDIQSTIEPYPRTPHPPTHTLFTFRIRSKKLFYRIRM